MSATVFRHGPYRFYFFSREEPRIHVHVQTSAGEAKFWLEPQIELAENFGLKTRQLNMALKLVIEHESEIRAAWAEHLGVEVANVSPHGFWLLIGTKEHFVPFQMFPWFRQATIAQLVNVELPSAHHLYWPDLDIDLAVESLTHPESYPLVSSKAVTKNGTPAKPETN